MFAQIDYIWVVSATSLFGVMILALVLYILHHNKVEIETRRWEQETTQEKQKLERRLEEANRMVVIGALAGGMAYYLNSTMFACKSLMSMLRNQLDGKQNVEHLAGLINEEIQRGLSVTDKLQQLALPVEVSFRPFNISELVHSVVDSFHQGLADYIAVEKSIDESGLVLVNGNKTLIRQVLLNLLINAVDAMSEPGVLHIETFSKKSSGDDQKSQHIPEPANMLEICITDSGIGMDDATRVRIFEPFFTTKEEVNRLGLGLPFVYGVMKIHNGKVDVESVKGQGTSVKLILPTLAQDQFGDYLDAPDTLAVADYLTLEDQVLLAKQQVGKA